MALLRLPHVLRLSGYSRSMLYSLISSGLYPKPVKIGKRAVAWPSYEAEQMSQAIISNKTSEQRRELVSSLEAKRETLEAKIVT